MQHQAQSIVRFFPRAAYLSMTENQNDSFSFLEKHRGETIVLEAPTGTGKTAIGYTFLRSQEGVRYYLVPNKTLVGQVATLHPDVQPMFGRNEHECLYYTEPFRADEVPCSILNCGHRVSMETGEIQDQGVAPCPYYKQKYDASKSSIVVATFAYYLYGVFYASKENALAPRAVVVDEAHGIAKSIRSVLVFRISSGKLLRITKALDHVDSSQADALRRFAHELKLLAKRRRERMINKDAVLDYEEIQQLLNALELVNTRELESEVLRALSLGELDVVKDREVLSHLQKIIRDLRRYIRALKFSLPPSAADDSRRRSPLSYVYAYWEKAEDKESDDHYELVIKDYFVAGLIKSMLPKNTLAYSATIIDPEVFAIETGIEGNFLRLGSNFPVENTRIFMPRDTEDLSMKGRSNRGLPKTIRKMVRTAKLFANQGKRSLIVVVSEFERAKVLTFAKEEGLNVLSYGNGLSARVIAQQFRNGDGDCLVGTVANYAEGIDLPDGMAPVIFCLRPAYPNPNDPQTMFEEMRYGQRRWMLWNWRVMVDLMQVRGRNVRSISDKGVTILMSQQFSRFAKSSLPEWLRGAYVNNLTFDDCVALTQKII